MLGRHASVSYCVDVQVSRGIQVYEGVKWSNMCKDILVSMRV